MFPPIKPALLPHFEGWEVGSYPYLVVFLSTFSSDQLPPPFVAYPHGHVSCLWGSGINALLLMTSPALLI